MSALFNYRRILDTALKMVARFGQPITITRRIEGAYNPSTSSVPITESTQSGIVGLFDNYKTKEIDGSLIKMGDVKMIVPGKGLIEPQAEDTLTDKNGTKWTIKDFDVIRPAGDPLLYTFQLRK